MKKVVDKQVVNSINLSEKVAEVTSVQKLEFLVDRKCQNI